MPPRLGIRSSGTGDVVNPERNPGRLGIMGLPRATAMTNVATTRWVLLSPRIGSEDAPKAAIDALACALAHGLCFLQQQ